MWSLRSGLYLLGAAAFLTACMPQPQSPGPGAATPSTHTPRATNVWRVETIAEQLQAPWAVVFYHETPIISERDTGRIVEITDDGDVRELALV